MSKRKPAKSVTKTTTAVPVAAPRKEKKSSGSSGLTSMTNWWLVLVLVLPVLISKTSMDPTVPIRYIFLGGFTLLFVVYFFGLRNSATSFTFPFLLKLVFGLGLGFVLWNLVSMSSALNPQEGYYEVTRHLLFLVVLFSILVTVQREESQLLKLCKALLFVAIFQGLAGILQFYDIAFTETPGANDKPYGLMANRNLFGSAQAFLLPFVIYVLYKASKGWKYISGIAIAVIIISLLLSQTRSAWLAAIAIIVVSLLLVIIFSPAYRKQWLIGTIAGAAGIALLAFVLIASDSEGTLKQSITERSKTLVQQSSGNSESVSNVSERIQIWKKTLQLIKDYPLKGAGPGNWKIAIPVYGSEGMSWADGKYSPDRAHNIYLQTAAETGIPGAIFYFGMWLLIAVIGIKQVIRPKSADQQIMVILMLAGLAAVACDGMLSFPTERIEHTLYMLLMGGIILGHYTSEAGAKMTSTFPVTKPMLWTGLVIVAASLFIGFKKYDFEVTLNRVKAFEQAKRFSEMANEASKGKNMYITLGMNIGISMELKRSIALKELKQYDEALKEISMAKRYHPNSAAVWNTEGTIYTELKQYDKAIYSYQQALKITPHHDFVQKNLATTYFLSNDFKNCLATIEQSGFADEDYFVQMQDIARQRMAALK